MRKRINKQAIYARPLPIVLSSERWGPLPEVFPHNPVSWVLFAWKWVLTVVRMPPHATVARVLVTFEDGVFKVVDDEQMKYLWCNGFFGKGTLSRSEPTWKQRTIDRLGLEGSENGTNVTTSGPQLLMEDLTTKRREERAKFKKLRTRLHQLEVRERGQTLSEEEKSEMVTLTAEVEKLRKGGFIEKVDYTDSDLSAEDAALFDPITRKLHKNLEFLQLQPEEVFFLAFTLNAVSVSGEKEFSLEELFQVCCESDPKFVQHYAVYHHFRSMGWCVRSGIKFGTDYLLYKRGPPFIHAEHAVMCMTDNCEYDWFEMSSIGRVIGTVKKNLVLAYTEEPEKKIPDGSDERDSFLRYFGQFKVTEIIYRRWAPGRTRD